MHDPADYGDRIAEIYDELYEHLFDVEATVTFLASFARGGRALELGIGTGRIAIPLADRGAEVHGVDASEKMVEKLCEKPGGRDIPVTIGDFVEPAVEGPFDLVYIPFSTLFGLITQDDQVRCFGNVAKLLGPEGAFVLDAYVPDLTRFDQHQRLAVESIAGDRVTVEATRHDPVAQRSSTRHLVMTPDGLKMYPVEVRYAWPAELDLMARLAGLRLAERWADYVRTPFTSESRNHVSVYEKQA